MTAAGAPVSERGDFDMVAQRMGYANKATLKAYQKAYREKNRDRRAMALVVRAVAIAVGWPPRRTPGPAPLPAEERARRRRETRLKGRDRRRSRMSVYRQANRDRMRAHVNKSYRTHGHKHCARHRETRMKLREIILDKGGRRCAKCGYDTDVRALHIDHVNGGGGVERRTPGAGLSRPVSRKSLPSLLARFDAGELQLLCANCNWIKRLEAKEDRWRQHRLQKQAAGDPLAAAVQ